MYVLPSDLNPQYGFPRGTFICRDLATDTTKVFTSEREAVEYMYDFHGMDKSLIDEPIPE